MKQTYGEIISNDYEFDERVKELLMSNCDKKDHLLAVKVTLESSDNEEVIETIDYAKEEKVINKLREKTGFTGIGLAGTSTMMAILMGLNIF